MTEDFERTVQTDLKIELGLIHEAVLLNGKDQIRNPAGSGFKFRRYLFGGKVPFKPRQRGNQCSGSQLIGDHFNILPVKYPG